MAVLTEPIVPYWLNLCVFEYEQLTPSSTEIFRPNVVDSLLVFENEAIDSKIPIFFWFFV